MSQLPIPNVTQRWRERRDSYRPAREPIDTSSYLVEPIEETEAKAFVIRHHYSASYPAARFRVGLFRRRDFQRPDLVGVVVFSVPMNVRTVPRYLGVGPNEGVELGRLVLLDDVPANGESWAVSRAFRLLREAKPEVRAVVAYSDPLPRRTDEGVIVMPGHYGITYQALNARHFGRSSSETLWRTADWRIVSRRALSKIRNDETGAAYAYRTLLAMGAPKRRAMEDGAAYVERALTEGPFTRVRHPGNIVYGWSLDRRAKAALAPGLPYPKGIAAPPDLARTIA